MKNVLTEQIIKIFQERFGIKKEEAILRGLKYEDRIAEVKRIGKRVVIIPKFREKYLPEFVINDVDVFEKNLQTYLNAIRTTDIKSTKMDNNHTEKYFLFNVWKNATFSDLSNPEKFILRYANFIKDDTFSQFDDLKLLGMYENNMLIAQRLQDDYGFETPYIMHLSLTNGKNIYNLPSIRYGISTNRNGDKIAYIYAIQKMEQSLDQEYNEKIKHSINRVNTGVKKYRNVTPSAIAALTVFMGMLEAEGINAVKAPDFLIGRYGNFINVSTAEETDRIQNNLTEKFLRNFLRLDSQLDNFRIEPIYISEFNSFLCMSLDKFENCKNQAIGQLYKIGRNSVLKVKDDEIKSYIR